MAAHEITKDQRKRYIGHIYTGLQNFVKLRQGLADGVTLDRKQTEMLAKRARDQESLIYTRVEGVIDLAQRKTQYDQQMTKVLIDLRQKLMQQIHQKSAPPKQKPPPTPRASPPHPSAPPAVTVQPHVPASLPGSQAQQNEQTPTLRQESPQPADVSRITVPEPIAPASGSVSRQLSDEGVPGGLQSVPLRRTSDDQKVEQLLAFADRLAPWKTQIDRKLEVGTVDSKVMHKYRQLQKDIDAFNHFASHQLQASAPPSDKLNRWESWMAKIMELNSSEQHKKIQPRAPTTAELLRQSHDLLATFCDRLHQTSPQSMTAARAAFAIISGQIFLLGKGQSQMAMEVNAEKGGSRPAKFARIEAIDGAKGGEPVKCLEGDVEQARASYPGWSFEFGRPLVPTAGAVTLYCDTNIPAMPSFLVQVPPTEGRLADSGPSFAARELTWGFAGAGGASDVRLSELCARVRRRVAAMPSPRRASHVLAALAAEINDL